MILIVVAVLKTPSPPSQTDTDFWIGKDWIGYEESTNFKRAFSKGINERCIKAARV